MLEAVQNKIRMARFLYLTYFGLCQERCFRSCHSHQSICKDKIHKTKPLESVNALKFKQKTKRKDDNIRK